MGKLILLLLIQTFFLLGTAPRNQFTRIDRSAGLSQNQVHAIVSDEWGFLWIATSDGLNRYDGHEFVVYRNDPANVNSLSNNYCYALCYDKERQIIWVGTYGGGLNLYLPERDQFTRIPLHPVPGQAKKNTEILAIQKDNQGRVWVAGDGLFLLEKEFNTFKPFSPPPVSPGLPFPDRITALSLTAHNQLLVGSKKGLWCIDTTTLQARMIHLGKDGESTPEIWSLFTDTDGFIWVGTSQNGLIQLNDQLTFMARFAEDTNKFFPTQSINCLAADSQKRLWIGTYGTGLILRKTSKPVFLHLPHLPQEDSSVCSDYINCIFESTDRLLWIGTENGLCRYDPEHEKITRINSSSPAPFTLPHNVVSSLLQAQNGDLWIGSAGGGIQHIMIEKNQMELYRQQNPDPQKISHDTIMKLVEDSQGFIWAATQDGLNRINPREKSVHQFHPDPASQQALKDSLIISLHADRQNRLWIGYNRSGVSILDLTTETWTHLSKEIVPSPSIWSFFQDHDQSMWIGSKNGLYHLSNQGQSLGVYTNDPNQPQSLSNDWVYAIFRDRKKRLWVGTAGSGLCLFLEKDKLFKRYDRRHGLPSDDILSIMEDEQGNIWLSTNQGICCFNPDTEQCRTFSQVQGLGSDEYNLDSAMRLSDGRFAYGSGAGLDIFNPQELLTATSPPKLLFTSLRINNQPQALTPPLHHRLAIEIPYSRDILTIEFAALDMRDAANTKYQYRLQGWNDRWIDTDAQNRRATFSQLPPGKFSLELRTLRPDSSSPSDIKRLGITIPAPFWRTGWFLALGGLLFSILSYLLINFLSGYISLKRFWKRTTRISTYKIEDRIGSGGMADVYAGRSIHYPDQRVAIKILRDDLKTDPVSLRRFRQEAAIIDQLDHPNIVRVFERGEQGDRPYIVMELLLGMPLSQKIRLDQGTPLKQAVPIILQIASALEMIHHKGILHRDLKPANIMLLNPPQKDIGVKLLDFGLARMTHHSRLTESGTVMGTLCYLSPEQITSGQSEAGSDIFALGVVVFELLSGSLPYDGCSAGDILNQILVIEAPTLEQKGLRLPTDIQNMVRLMLAKSPAARPSLHEIMETFARYA